MEYLCKNIKKKIWIRSAGLYLERMDLNIRHPHSAINDANYWYRGNDPRTIITYRGTSLWRPCYRYAIFFLRAEPEKPTCDRHPNIEAQVKEQMKANASDDFASFFGAASESDVRASLPQRSNNVMKNIRRMIKLLNISKLTQGYVLTVLSRQVSLVFLNLVQKTVPFYWSLWF